MLKPLPRPEMLAVVAATLVLSISAGTALDALRTQRLALDWVVHTREVQVHVWQMIADWNEAQSSQRGYLLTGSVPFLQSFDGASRRLRGELQTLRALTADNPRQQRALDALDALAAQGLGSLRQTIARFQAGGSAAPLAILGGVRDLPAPGGMRSRVGDMEAEEGRLLGQRTDAARQARGRSVAALMLLAALALMLLWSLMLTATRARRRIRSSEQRLATILGSIADGVIATDSAGRIERLNAAAERLTGWRKSEALGQPVDKVFRVADEVAGASGAGPEPTAAPGAGLAKARVLRDRAGREYVIRDSEAPILDAAGSADGFVHVFQDTTTTHELELGRQRAEATLQRQFEQLTTLIRQSPLGMYLVDADMRMRHVNPVALRSFAGIPGGVEGRDFEEVTRIVWPEPFASELLRIVRHTLYTGEAYEQPELIQPRADRKSTEYLAWRVDRIAQADGRHAVVCYFSDISRPVQAREALALSNAELSRANERLQLVQEAAEIGYWDWDLGSGGFTCSERCARLLGVAPGTAMSYEGFIERAHPEDRQRVDAAVRRSLQDRQLFTVEMRVPLPDRVHWIVVRGRAAYSPQGHPVRMLGMALDVSDLREAEESVRQAERHYRQVLEALPLLVWTCSSEGKARFLSPQWLRYTGGTLEDSQDLGWARYVHADDRERLLRLWSGCLASGQSFDTEVRIRGADGVFRWFKQRAVPLRRPDGTVQEWFGTSTEISDLIEARETIRAANAQLEQRVMERTRALEDANGELEAYARTIAHDLRAPLRNIQGYATALLEDDGERLSADGAQYATRMSESAVRMDGLIQDLLAYSRLARTDIILEPVDLDALVRRVLADLEAEVQSRRACVHVAGRLPIALGNRLVLSQVIENLLANALKFVGPGPSAPRVTITAQAPDERHIVLTVADQGIGIAREHQERIFRVFERLHGSETYPGTGIGLAIVRKGVERLGGRVWVESEAGRGARFSVELSAASTPASGAGPDSATSSDA